MAQINNYDAFKHYFTRDDVFDITNLVNFMNTNFNDLSSYKRLSYFNELVIKFDQIKLGLLYGNLNEAEKKILQKSLELVIDRDGNGNYNLTVKGRKR